MWNLFSHSYWLFVSFGKFLFRYFDQVLLTLSCDLVLKVLLVTNLSLLHVCMENFFFFQSVTTFQILNFVSGRKDILHFDEVQFLHFDLSPIFLEIKFFKIIIDIQYYACFRSKI